MAPTKNIVEVPRSILPRLTWNSSSRPTVSSYHPAFSAQQRQHQGWTPLTRSAPALSSSHQSVRAFSTAIRGPQAGSLVSQRTSTSAALSQTPESTRNPIRHNGVYVATFKTAQRAFHATPARQRDHHFDTLRFVKRLQAEGFSEEQAVAMMRVLNDIIQESIQNLTRTMVLREGSISPTMVMLIISSSLTADRFRENNVYPKSRLRQTPLRTAKLRLDRSPNHPFLA